MEPRSWERVISLLMEAKQAMKTTQWNSPVGLPQVRADLKGIVESGRGDSISWEYSPVDTTSAATAVGRVRACNEASGHPLAELVERELDSMDQTLSAFSRRSQEGIQEWSIASFGLPSDKTLALADALLDEPEVVGSDSEARFSPEDVRIRMQGCLDAYSLPEWTIEVSGAMAPRMSIRPLSRLIRVRSDATFSAAEVDRLAVHEIGCHVLRSANAQRQPERLAALSLGRSTHTEEGLAVWLEGTFGVSNRLILRTYASRVWAVHLAATHGIVEIARTLSERTSLETAIECAVRVKRGLPDPNAPGVMSRDHAYLTGLKAIESAVAAAPDVPSVLMATKWPLEYIATARQLLSQGDLHHPGLMPDARLLGIST